MPQIEPSLTSPWSGTDLQLTAASNGDGVRYEWDLDDDGAYDDATDGRVIRRWAAGRHVVAVRATDRFGRTGVERRSFLAHDFNAQPTIDFDLGIGKTPAGQPLGVRVTGKDYDGKIAKVELDGDGDGTYEVMSTDTISRNLTFTTGGNHLVRARVVDDGGAVATATATVPVSASAPALGIGMGSRDDWYGDPVPPGPTTITVSATNFTPVHTQLDLDGDGAYETDIGAAKTYNATFAAGEHTVGARAKDADGHEITARSSHLVAPAASPPPWLRHQYVPGAYVGQPVDLQVEAFPEYRVYTLEWDADGDGAFDDGTFTTPGGSGPVATEGHNTFTYTAPGVYDVRVKVTDPLGASRVESQTITVSPAVTGPAFSRLTTEYLVRPAGTFVLTTKTAPGATLTYDLDGDGQFDDPGTSLGSGLVSVLITKPGPVAVKATGADGGASVRTLDIVPLTGNLGPRASLYLHQTVPMPLNGSPELFAGQRLDAYGSGSWDDPGCCNVSWDLDGDGAYDDATGLFPSFVLESREYTLGSLARDYQGDAEFVRQTFTAGTAAPTGDFAAADSMLTGRATDPDGVGIAAYRWDLDGDGDFDDATGQTVRALEGRHRVGLAAVDAAGDIGVGYATVTGDPLPPSTDTPPPPREQPAPPKQAPLTLTIGSLKLTSKTLTLRATCSAACSTTVTVKLGTQVLGKATGKGGTVKVKLSASARKQVRKARGRKLTIVASAPGAKSVTKTMKIKPN